MVGVKQTIVDSSSVPDDIDWMQWLFIIYIIGIMVALFLLILDVYRMTIMYSSGTKTQENGWTIITTGKDHAPFSLLNLLFISNRKMYSAEEWEMILDHERKHTTLRHIADLLLMQAARIIFWFHPLVYIYNKRLLLVHEYQADNASARQPQVYGAFLVEQAILQTAPSLSHSFIRSPIKNRIVMLTRKSSAASQTKMLLFIPLALVCFFCFSKNGFAQKFVRKGNTVTYKGNTIVYAQDSKVDTVTMVDPVSGNEITRYIKKNPVPGTINGEKIYSGDTVSSRPQFNLKYGSLRKFIISKLADQLKKLPDGAYDLNIRDVVIDASGKVVYYDYKGFERFQFGPGGNVPIPAKLQKEINNQIEKTMDNVPAYIPATYHNKNVPASLNYGDLFDSIDIKDHKITN